MLCITLESDDPFFNLAIEEVLLKSSSEEFLILGINRPSVIIGKHQLPHREVNTKFVTENDIPVIRRISGGGTVFHDRGNLNFTFIRRSEEGKQVDFKKHTLPVIKFLSASGIDAKLEGKNDIKVDGLKISGNAEHVHRNRVLHHGTLLFSTNMDLLGNSIRKNTSAYTSRAVGSNPSSVINLGELLKEFADINEFRREMMNYLIRIIPGAEIYSPALSEMKDAGSLAMSKYRTWEWNFAYGPEYTFNNSFRINGKHHTCSLLIKDGLIANCIIEGSPEMKSVADELTGCRHMAEDVKNILDKVSNTGTEELVYSFF